jgi:hypothetical protein
VTTAGRETPDMSDPLRDQSVVDLDRVVSPRFAGTRSPMRTNFGEVIGSSSGFGTLSAASHSRLDRFVTVTLSPGLRATATTLPGNSLRPVWWIRLIIHLFSGTVDVCPTLPDRPLRPPAMLQSLAMLNYSHTGSPSFWMIARPGNPRRTP